MVSHYPYKCALILGHSYLRDGMYPYVKGGKKKQKQQQAGWLIYWRRRESGIDQGA